MSYHASSKYCFVVLRILRSCKIAIAIPAIPTVRPAIPKATSRIGVSGCETIICAMTTVEVDNEEEELVEAGDQTIAVVWDDMIKACN